MERYCERGGSWYVVNNTGRQGVLFSFIPGCPRLGFLSLGLKFSHFPDKRKLRSGMHCFKTYAKEESHTLRRNIVDLHEVHLDRPLDATYLRPER